MTTKGKFEKLVEAIRMQVTDEPEDFLELVEKDMCSFGEYVNAVMSMEVGINIARARLEGEELRDRIMQLDQRRRDCHEMAIVGVKRLNRFAEQFNVPKIYLGDVEDRYSVADFCMETVNEFFSTRSGNVTRFDEKKAKGVVWNS